jgi:hypothetical protein
MPSLVFSNACHTGHSGEWKLSVDYEEKIFGLANAFLLAGVQHYVGTFWEIPDETGHCFAISFYQNLVQGATIGSAIQKARQRLIEKYGEDTIVWAGYMLYGDPGIRYVQPEGKAESIVEPLRSGNESVVPIFSHADYPANIPANKRTRIIAIVATALLLVTGVAYIMLKPTGIEVQSRRVEYGALVQNQKQIDELVASLAARYREGKFEQLATHDEWSSRPLSLAVMNIKNGSAGEQGSVGNEKFIDLLNRSLLADQAITVVERQILEKLLAELKLGSSSLADPSTALKLGKLFAARFIVTGTVVREKGGQTAILRLIDTETSAVGKMITAQSAEKEIGPELCNDLSRQIGEWLQAEFPLKGKIISVAGRQCSVNLGKIHGLKKGTQFEVVAEAKKGSGIYIVTGELEVSDVNKDTSTVLIIVGSTAIREQEKIRVKK